MTEKINWIKDETAEKVAEVKSKLEQKIDEHRLLLEQLTIRVNTNYQQQAESEMVLKNIVKLDERLEALTDACRKAAEVESASFTMCECCGRDGIRKNMLVKIDSGQFVCPTCLRALRSFKS